MNPNQAVAAEHDVAVNGIALHYATWGTRTTPERAVVLVHGVTSNHKSFSLLGLALAAEGWFAIAPDLRGRGLSGKPPHGYGIQFNANDLLSLCDALELPQVHMVGHSLGAFIELYLGALHAPRLRSLIFVDGGGTVPPDAYESLASSVKRIGVPFPSLDAFLAQLRAAAPFAWTPFWDAYYTYDVETRPDGTVMARMPLAAYMEEVGNNAALNFELLWRFVKAPTLVARATIGLKTPTSGFILTPEEAQRLVATIPGCQLVEIPDTNHYTIITADALTQAVLGFLRQQ